LDVRRRSLKFTGEKPVLKRHDVGHEYGDPKAPIMSQAIEDGALVHIAGMTAHDKRAPFAQQTREVLEKIDGYLSAAGATRSGLLSALVLVEDIAQRREFNPIWASWIDPANPPTRTCVAVGFEGTTNVEVIVIARKGNPMAIKRHEIGPVPGGQGKGGETWGHETSGAPLMSKVVEDGDTVYLSGMTATDKTKDIKGQTREVVDKIDRYLALAGANKSGILSALIHVSDIRLRPQMNEIWNGWVDPGNPPVRACVAAGLEGNTLVEITITARK
jgi:enamine deaminase RidA (YjgF/YER057c/UK114 family)